MHRLVAAAVFLGILGPTARAQDSAAQALPIIGSDGGTAFTRQCPAGQVLTGIRARTGVLIDALGIRCRPVNGNGSLGTESNVGTLAGGTGGTASSGSCPAGTVVSGEGVAKGVPIGLASFDLRCRRWDAATRSFTGDLVAVIHVIGASGAGGVVINAIAGTGYVRDCPRQQQPVVLLRGRSGTIVDAAGLTCNEP
jgi:hypothetical protein